MFFLVELTRSVELHPRYFGTGLEEMVEKRLREEVEGNVEGNYGYVIAVAAVKEISSGVLQQMTALATFDVLFSAVVFRPFKGEVLDAIVTQVNQVGFFAEVGPLSVFVSAHLIPSDFEFRGNSYRDTKEDVSIAKDSEVRLKIVGSRVDATQIFAVGTIKEDYLGPTE